MGHMKELDIRIRSGGEDAIAAACELVPKWIPTSERLPGDGLVLACTPDSDVIVIAGWSEKECQWTVPEWFGGANHGKRKKECFSHWMPLPEPPR